SGVPGVELDAAEVDHPGQRRRVVDHGEDGCVAARKADELLADVVRVWRHSLLVEEVAVDAVRIPHHVEGPSGCLIEHMRCKVEVVLDEVTLRQPERREEDLVQVGELDLAVADAHESESCARLIAAWWPRLPFPLY